MSIFGKQTRMVNLGKLDYGSWDSPGNYYNPYTGEYLGSDEAARAEVRRINNSIVGDPNSVRVPESEMPGPGETVPLPNNIGPLVPPPASGGGTTTGGGGTSGGGTSGGLMDGNYAAAQANPNPAAWEAANQYPWPYPNVTPDPNPQPGTLPDWQEYMDRAQAFYDQAAAIQPEGGEWNVDAPTMEAITREVGTNELAGTRLNALLDPNSPWAARARQEGIDYAASRGLMNSSIAGGNALGAWIDRAQPIALSEAQAYQQAAESNLAARNAAASQNANAELQARLAEAGFTAQDIAAMREYLLGQATDLNRAYLNIENREDTQAYGTAERLGQQAWQTGERMGTQQWQTGERLGGQAWQTGERLGGQQWQTGERIGSQQFQASENALQRGHELMLTNMQQAWQTAERVAQQNYNTSERLGIQAWTSNERLDTQYFTDEQRQAAEDFQRDRDALDAALRREGIAQQDRQVWLAAWTGVQTGQYNSIGQAAAMIYANTELTPQQQQAAVQNMMAFFAGIAPELPPAPAGIYSQQSVYPYGYPLYPYDQNQGYVVPSPGPQPVGLYYTMPKSIYQPTYTFGGLT